MKSARASCERGGRAVTVVLNHAGHVGRVELDLKVAHPSQVGLLVVPCSGEQVRDMSLDLKKSLHVRLCLNVFPCWQLRARKATSAPTRLPVMGMED